MFPFIRFIDSIYEFLSKFCAIRSLYYSIRDQNFVNYISVLIVKSNRIYKLFHVNE